MIIRFGILKPRLSVPPKAEAGSLSPLITMVLILASRARTSKVKLPSALPQYSTRRFVPSTTTSAACAGPRRNTGVVRNPATQHTNAAAAGPHQAYLPPITHVLIPPSASKTIRITAGKPPLIQTVRGVGYSLGQGTLEDL